MINLAGLPHIYDAKIQRQLDSGNAKGELSITATIRRDCPVCGCGSMAQEAVISTGLALDHYQPERGEVLKNRWMVCNSCGFDQAS